MDQSNPRNYLDAELEYFARIQGYFEGSSGSFSEKAYPFPRFVPRQALSYFLARNEVYRQIVGTHGSILDFGVYRGGSFTWQQLGALYEPYNHVRKVVGFDSFGGFSEVGERDVGADGQDLALKKQGGMAYDGARKLREGIKLQDMNRPRPVKGNLLVFEDLNQATRPGETRALGEISLERMPYCPHISWARIGG
jgi:hypothetical protein